jgi:dipeptidyl aminopeptidase/acylaminoacyl peptidase
MTKPKPFALVAAAAAIALCICAVPFAQSKPSVYLTPPKVIADLMDAEPLPGVSLSPDRTVMLLTHRKSMPSIAEVAAPFYGLGGARINPKTNGPRLLGATTRLVLRNVSTGVERPLVLPPAVSYSGVFSPDSKSLAITVTTSSSIGLYVANIATAAVKPVVASGVNALGGGCRWLDSSSGFLCSLIPAGRGPEPRAPAVPTGPAIQENTGTAAPSPTFEDLLKNPHDEKLYEHFYTSQLTWVDLAGAKTPFGTPGVYQGANISPDSRFVIVTRIKRPFSYVVPSFYFPRDVEVWSKAGALVKKLADVPMADTFPRNGVFPGARGFQWHLSEPATLVYLEALDGGDPQKKVEYRDRVMTLPAPFTAQPAERAKTAWRAGGLQFTEAGTVFLTESDRDSRMRRTWLFEGGLSAAPRKIWELRQQDRYGDPGFPITRASTGRVIQSGDTIYLSGAGASAKGDRPFVDAFSLKTLQTTRLWQCDDTSYETFVALLDDRGTRMITRRESKVDPPNYHLRDTAAKSTKAITSFVNPQPQLEGITSQFVTYKRKDGVQLNGTVYLPAGYKPGTRLPVFLWAYPAEFTSADDAQQISGNPNRFLTVSGASQLLLLTQGYAVFNDATMPIIGPGETANDTYIDQLVASAAAAIDKIVDMGLGDRDRVGVGGHSYGAFMTANLLANSRLFRAGIARSGAYNRTLTPFGFQNETRNFWEVPEIYSRMSPFFRANQIKDPILLIHGEMDDNSGTFPIQSERLYMALKGFGATVRYVTLPHEAHGYAAAESNKHVISEMLNFLDKYVKNVGPKPQ